MDSRRTKWVPLATRRPIRERKEFFRSMWIVPSMAVNKIKYVCDIAGMMRGLNKRMMVREGAIGSHAGI